VAKLPFGELRRQFAVATDQRGRRIAVALGLEDLVALDGAELADRPVDRADEVGSCQRPAPSRSGRVKNSLKLA
jgi:hypothetical protein